MPESQLLSVRGGEDYAFSGFSVRVIPSLHSALNGKHFFDSRVVPRDFRGPRRLGSDVEGGTLAYLLRLAGYQILWFGSMNYIEREVQGLRPDVAMIAAARSAANPRDPSPALRAPHSAADASKCIRIETLTCRRKAGSMAAMGVYDQIKKAFQDIIAPELHAIRGDIRLLDQKIDGVNNSLSAKIDGADARLNLKLDGMKGELLAEIRRLDTRINGVDVRIDGIDRNLQIAIEIRERLAALEARRSS